MTVIVSDFSGMDRYLSGAAFAENLSVHYEKRGPIRWRNDIIVDRCRGLNVLHIGCCDHIPLLEQKIARNEWLHGQITSCSRSSIGIDINPDSVRAASEISGLDNIFAGDISSDTKLPAIANNHFDLVIFGEVIEHISNPVQFLNSFRKNYRDNFNQVMATVPNAFRGGNIKGIIKNSESINSDHRFFFTPYTIAKIVTDAGFAPISIEMASFAKSSKLKTWLTTRLPLLAEDIVLVGAPGDSRQQFPS